jgi:cytochrome c oxidase subunit 2
MITPIIAALFQPSDAPVFPAREEFWMPSARSTVAEQIDWLYFYLYWVSLISTVGVIAAMAYFVFKYKAKSRKTERPQPSSDHNTTLEITWSVIPLGIVISFFFLGFKGFAELRTPPKDSMEVYVTGQKWSWSFRHKNGCTDNVLHVPVQRNVRLVITSVDVLHSVWVPNFRVKMDAVPGRFTDLWFNATQPGEYPLECTEYCGTSHSDMLSKVIVEDQAAYDTYLADCTKVEISAEGGAKLYEKRGCKTCHSVDGTKLVGPTFKGLWGKDESTTSGSVKVDENYIRESIMEPQAKIVSGFAPTMPTYKGQISDDEIAALIEYLKSLK